MSSTVLILGPTGRFGRNCAEAFTTAGWHVRRFRRASDDLATASKGVDVIVNGWNPLYPDWAKQVPTLTRQVISAAKANKAAVILPGNVYVYGVNAPERFAPDTPHTAQNPLGQIRIAMERAYRDAEIQTIILRSGDYIDTIASGNWFDQIMAAKAARGRFSYPGALTLRHAFAYLPDVGRAAVHLAEMRAELGRYEDITFAGYTLTGQQLGEAVQHALSQDVKIKSMSWWPIQLASPFWPLAKHLLEMRYLWNKPHYLDGTYFDTLCPNFQTTPLNQAMVQALEFQVNPHKPMARAVTQQRV